MVGQQPGLRLLQDPILKTNPLLQVRQVAEEAIARARRGEGPTLIEAETYRFRGHSLADPDELRTKEEKDYYLVRLAAGPG
jgi:TPP-dependent pyruvate/acetoin dehydrogenase alpha subunit